MINYTTTEIIFDIVIIHKELDEIADYLDNDEIIISNINNENVLIKGIFINRYSNDREHLKSFGLMNISELICLYLYNFNKEKYEKYQFLIDKSKHKYCYNVGHITCTKKKYKTNGEEIISENYNKIFFYLKGIKTC